jgi:hypothetical protein
MRLKHNKKRNTAFIYEILIKELSKASMNNLQERKIKIISILKNFFSKGKPLREELEIYQSFNDLLGINENTIQKIISEARHQSSKLDYGKIYENQTKIIGLINKNLGQESWNTFIRDYKKVATVNQAVFFKTNPKKQVFIEQKLVEILMKSRAEKKSFPNINKLTLTTFLDKFNDEYGKSLNEHQKELLNKFITSYNDDGLELKIFLYDELDRLKNNLKKEIKNNNDDYSKFELILEKMESYSSKKIDKKMITEIIKIQSLVSEINNGANT